MEVGRKENRKSLWKIRQRNWGGDLKRKMMMIEHGRERIGERSRDLGMEGLRGGPGQVRIVEECWREKKKWND
jgi:hypothetical protein